jgi:hypothetical protein
VLIPTFLVAGKAGSASMVVTDLSRLSCASDTSGASENSNIATNIINASFFKIILIPSKPL